MTANTAEAASWKRYEQMRPRVAIVADLQNMRDCVGHYQLDVESVFHVFEDGEKLMAQLTGQVALQIFPEAKDKYFYTAVPAQLAFERDHKGKIVALVLHQNGVEQPAKRISLKEANALAEALSERVKSGKPTANSRDIMEAILRGQIAGKPRTDLMDEGLAQLVREQSDGLAKELAEFGNLKSLDFITITPEGLDVFRATFENGELDCSIHLRSDGKADGAMLEPPRTEEFWKKIREKVLR